MGYVVSVYTMVSFKEYILPVINNSDYEITLRSSEFKLRSDLQIKMEIMNGEWKIKNSNDYIGVGKSGKVLEQNLVLNLETKFGEKISVICKYLESNFHAYKKFNLTFANEITIGKEMNNTICYDFLGMVSRNHAKLVRTQRGFQLINSSTNGSYVNSVKIEGSIDLPFGAFINIMGLHIVYLGDLLAIDIEGSGIFIDGNVLQPYENLEDHSTVRIEAKTKISDGPTTYHRAPRNYEKVEETTIEIEEAPEKKTEEKKTLLLSLGPAVSMVIPMMLGYAVMAYAQKESGGGSILMMASGIVMMLGSSFFSVIWTVLQLRDEKNRVKEDNKLRFEAYSKYLIDCKNKIETIYNETIRKYEETYPSASACLAYDENAGVLWNRNYTHDDFLTHRLGIGEKKFQCDIIVPKVGFTLKKDDLREQPAKIKENFKTLYNVPIVLDLLKKRMIGIVGGESKKNAIDVAKILSVQLAANNCYTDVKLVYIYNNETSGDHGQWEFAKWFPHTWSEDKNTRFVSASKEDLSEVLYEITQVMRNREENMREMNSDTIPKPYYVVFVSNPELLAGQSFVKYINSKKSVFGLTTILLAERNEQLPNECEFIIENSANFKGMYDVYQSRKERQLIQFDSISDVQLASFARHLTSLHVPETEEGGEIPNAITFFDMYNINRIEEYPVAEMWAKCRTYENIKGMLGVRSGGAPSYLDVHEKYHGPHGLVAGTTGSGKSETLQTYILSLAINYSPDDIGFFVIDYKGGGMANLFNGLPHLIGSISNLSGNQVKRAMISIKSENRRRQRVFSENGVNNINLYTKLYKNGEATLPVPHMFIIIDEFAELKREEPEFMKELISVAQVGRSLGVHLILATQKPSGTVDDNIWSNSKFRLCLRVQDKADSVDMLHKEDAAFITQAGRGYLQVGNDELYELFQSGFSGAVYSEHMVASTKDVAKMLSLPGKVEMTGNSVKQSQKVHAEIIWINTLCECMQLAVGIASQDSTVDMNDVEHKINNLVDAMYKVFEEKKIEYPVSEFNTVRLKDFIGMYGAIVSQGNQVNISRSILEYALQNNIKLPEAKEKTQLDVTISYLAKVAEENGYTHDIQLWMPVLPEKIYLDEFEEYRKYAFDGINWKNSTSGKLEIIIGKADDPENQNQMPVVFDFIEQGHMAIMGSIVSGRSTFAQTVVHSLIQRYSPEYVNLYLVDFSSKSLGAFEQAPHVGGVVFEDDDEKILKFMTMLKRVISERKKILSGGNYKQYIEKNGVKLPAIILVFDNLGSFRQNTDTMYDEFMVQISKEGASLGIYMVVTGQAYKYEDIPNRIGENIEVTFALNYNDLYTYKELLHTMNIDIMPESGVKGRGLCRVEGRVLEYQVALALEAENDYQRIEKLTKISKNMRATWTGSVAEPIPMLPEKPVYSEFSMLPSFKSQIEEPSMIPVGYNMVDADAFSLDMRDFYCYLVTGNARTGKTNFMRVLLQSVLMKDADICIIDNSKKEFMIYQKKDNVTYLDSEEAIVDYFEDVLTSKVTTRNEKKWELFAQEKEEDEVFDIMLKEEKALFIFIADMVEFTTMANESEAGIDGFMETLTEKGSLHNIYFIAEVSLQKVGDIQYEAMFNNFIAYQTGIHFGGKVEDNSVMSFDYVEYSKHALKQPVGVGMLPGDRAYDGVEKILVPVARK
ncbi:MAG: type VII secretion protein EssC [Lachnospiraceae bacterium]|nr:type VII secretion protein EssC [Lachnospiraceae bacterium]